MADGGDIFNRRGVQKGPLGPWPEDRVEKLKALHAQGLSASQIAKQLGGVTRNAVIGKCIRIGLTREAPSKPRAPAQVKAPSKPKRPAWSYQVKPNSEFTPGIERDPTPLPIREVPPTAKPWLERAFGECAFPVGGEGADTLSCCAPTDGEPYCATCRSRMYQPFRANQPSNAKSLERSLRRFASL